MGVIEQKERQGLLPPLRAGVVVESTALLLAAWLAIRQAYCSGRTAWLSCAQCEISLSSLIIFYYLQAPGCILPGSGQKIETATLRGVESSGMLCSAFDVGWSSSPDGVLIELPESATEGDKISREPMKVPLTRDFRHSSSLYPRAEVSLLHVMLL